MQQISEVLVNGVRKRHSSLIDRFLKISSHQRVLPRATTIRLRMVVLILSICVHMWHMWHVMYEIYTCDMSCVRFTQWHMWHIWDLHMWHLMYEIHTCHTYEIYTCDMSCVRFTHVTLIRFVYTHVTCHVWDLRSRKIKPSLFCQNSNFLIKKAWTLIWKTTQVLYKGYAAIIYQIDQIDVKQIEEPEYELG